VAARLLRLWVRIPPGAWIFVCYVCCVLSGRGFCDELIIRPEESYRLWCVVVCDLETSWMGRPWPTGGGLLRQKKGICISHYHCFSIDPTTSDLIRHPSSSTVNDEPYAHSYQDNSLWYTPGLWTRNASFIHRNVPSWLKYLLARERRALIGQYGNYFLSPWVQRLLVSVDYCFCRLGFNVC
jgi:hypothetical protein